MLIARIPVVDRIQQKFGYCNVSHQIDISVVIPVYNELESIEPLVDRLDSCLAQLPLRSEVVFVDDGSSDGTALVLSSVGESDDLRVLVRTLRHETNKGYHAALMAGVGAASGEFVLSMDGDLQHPPEVALAMLKLIVEGSMEVVYGVGLTPAESLSLKRASRWIYPLVLRFLGVRIPKGSNDFRVIRRSALDLALGRFGEHVPLRVSIPQVTKNFSVVNFEIPAREFGHTKFGTRRMLKLFFQSLNGSPLCRAWSQRGRS